MITKEIPNNLFSKEQILYALVFTNLFYFILNKLLMNTVRKVDKIN